VDLGTETVLVGDAYHELRKSLLASQPANQPASYLATELLLV
jgi:hypothetical protein